MHCCLLQKLVTLQKLAYIVISQQVFIKLVAFATKGYICQMLYFLQHFVTFITLIWGLLFYIVDVLRYMPVRGVRVKENTGVNMKVL